MSVIAHAAQAAPDPDLASRRGHRIALVSAGQTPRRDIVRDIASFLPPRTDVVEYGVLDGLSDAEIDGLAPRPGERSIATRLAAGRPVVLSRVAVEDRVQRVLSGMSAREFDLVGLLSTGFVREFAGACPVINLQSAMERTIAALATSGRRVGLIQPIERQVHEGVASPSGYRLAWTWLDADDPRDLDRVAADCAGCETLVLNSIAYDEATSERLTRLTGKTVLLPRRVLGAAARMLMDAAETIAPVSMDAEARMARLTPREREVMWLMVEGLQSKEIGRRLSVSSRTVDIHRARVLGKIGVASTHALIHFALLHVNRSGGPAAADRRYR
ncbi:MAG: hypothetical protein BGP06_14760 [Rhizobiales bacterium 65-9]|nr:AroM family protein [Hyphomicrobiales bacterium]OJY36910.1 MAG: hypothetical protein BGP06_14760 [Rhizobiales bacterium 65-9]